MLDITFLTYAYGTACQIASSCAERLSCGSLAWLDVDFREILTYVIYSNNDFSYVSFIICELL